MLLPAYMHIFSPRIALTPDGSLLALSSHNQVYVWEMPSGTLIGRLDHWIDDFADLVQVIRFSPDGTRLLVGTIGNWEPHDDRTYNGSLTMWKLNH